MSMISPLQSHYHKWVISTLTYLKCFNQVLNDTQRRATSLQQLSFLHD